jgi:hypothetical protein
VKSIERPGMREPNGDVPRMTDKALNAERWRIEHGPAITPARRERLGLILAEIARRDAAYRGRCRDYAIRVEAEPPRVPSADCVDSARRGGPLPW